MVQDTITEISRLGFCLSADPNITHLLQKEHPEILAGIKVGWITSGIVLGYLFKAATHKSELVGN